MKLDEYIAIACDSHGLIVADLSQDDLNDLSIIRFWGAGPTQIVLRAGESFAAAVERIPRACERALPGSA